MTWPGARKLGPASTFLAASSTSNGSFSMAFVENFATFPFCLEALSLRGDHGREFPAPLAADECAEEEEEDEDDEGWVPAPIWEAAHLIVVVWHNRRGLWTTEAFL